MEKPVKCPIHIVFPRWKFPQDENRGEMACPVLGCTCAVHAWNYPAAVEEWNWTYGKEEVKKDLVHCLSVAVVILVLVFMMYLVAYLALLLHKTA